MARFTYHGPVQSIALAVGRTKDKEGNEVSGKSIMGLMTLEASRGSVIRITVDGSDAEALMNDISQLIESKFYED